MVKKGVMLFALFVFVFLVSGCQTVAGTAKGATQGATEGIQKDWEAAKKTDAWMRKNLW